MIDASDLSIVIPFRGDSVDRLENLEAVVRFFARYARGYELVILENGKQSVAGDLADYPEIKYFFEENDGPFHKTKLLNRAVQELSARPFVASYDADTLLFPHALQIAMDHLRAGHGMVLPFSGDLFDLRRSARRAVIAQSDLDSLSPAELLLRRGKLGWRDLLEIVYVHDTHVGGAVLFNRNTFTDCGGYNENFVSWGYEDNEIVERLGKFGVSPVRVPGYPLLHLSHRRGADSGKMNPFFRNNVIEYRRISSCTPSELRKRIASGALKSVRLPPVGATGRIESALWRAASLLGIR
jgi:hypothetical protein